MAGAAAGLLASPLDWLLHQFESRLYRRAPEPGHPILIVVGPPRSGTTLVAQTLIRYLRANYFNNLTSLFPRAPIIANRLIPGCMRPERVQPRSFYGRTAGLTGHSDALYLWDRWLGKGRNRIVTTLDKREQQRISRFFGAFQAASPGPLVVKNNSLNTCASLIAEALPTARFVCLQRDPRTLAQSLLTARKKIHSNARVPYGIGPAGFEDLDPAPSVRAQIRFLDAQARQQQRQLGSDRFWMLSYEDFCDRPRHWVRTLANRLGIFVPPDSYADLRPFQRRRISEEQVGVLSRPTIEQAGQV